LGKQLNSDLTHEWFTVVGVARDSKVSNLGEKPTPAVFLPQYQVPMSQATIVGSTTYVMVRTMGDPMAFRKTLEKTISELNANLVVFGVTTLDLNDQFASFPQRIAGTFVGAFGLLALILAAVGIYGVTAYTTRQRTHEIGIRVALGASKEDILRLVLGQGFRLTLIGVVIGLAASFALTRYLTILLLGVRSTDAITFLSVTGLLCAVALFACFIPTRRAMRVDPLVALRYE
jgi:ABC-type antimicrobial peptide transport system permease subunit